ncbi:MAG: alpha/beta hydrolase [Candidatus Thiodiazotropha sp.]
MPHKNPSDATLVLLPGLDGTGDLFAPFLAALPSRLATRVIDYPDRALSLEQLAEHTRSRLPEGKLVLLAESFSGLVALTLLSRFHLPLTAIIFCVSFATSPRPWLVCAAKRRPIPRLLLRLATDPLLKYSCLGPQASAAQIKLLRDTLGKVEPKTISQRLNLIDHFRPPLRKPLHLPCYYLQGSDDHLVPARAADWFERHFSPFHLQQITGPHFLLQANPGRCAAAVVSFLGSLNKFDNASP